VAFDICPWWMGYLLISPLRRLMQDPHKLLAPFVRAGMTVLEPGPGMGFFTLELARLVGPAGRVVAVDVQPKMLEALMRRARKAGLAERIVCREPRGKSLAVDDLSQTVDFVLAMAVVHELPDAALFFRESFAALRPGGTLLLAEPSGHVDKAAWQRTLHLADEAGLREARVLTVSHSHAVLLERPI
jgi:ubiquinone/menaquinone biosynthesis C-methylase UbiE